MRSSVHRSFVPILPSALGVLAAACVAPLATGCIADRPEVEAEQTVSASLALPDTIVFRFEGGPVDEPFGGEALPLADAVRRSIETSPELQAALARVRAAQADADRAGLLPNPVVSLVFRFPEGGGKPDVEAGLAADLLAILQRPRRSSAAWNRLESEGASALSTALDVLSGTQELYASVQALDALVPLLEGRLTVLQRLREVAQARLELGEGIRQDVTTLDAERVELEVEVSRRRQELRLARLALARRIGEPSGAAAWRLDAWRSPSPVPVEERAWIGAALRARPEVLAIEWELRARGDETALAGWGAFEGASIGVEAERAEDWSVGPGASTPLPVLDTGSARTRRARSLEAEARHRLTEVQRSVVEEVRTSLAALAGAQENLGRIVSDLIPLQEHRRADIEEAYRVGQVDVTALLLAEQALQATHVRRVELEHEVSNALVRLQRAVGGPSAFVSTVSGEGHDEP